MKKITRRKWLGAIACSSLFFVSRHAAAQAESAAAPAAKPPNVLFIISDDMNTRLHCYGDSMVQTPNLDRLAGRGVRFDRGYCQYPVCNPSRTSFLTGMYPEATGITNQSLFLRKDGRTPAAVYLPDYFKAHGYFTAGLGKVEHAGHTDIHWDMSDTLLPGGARSGDDEEGGPKRARGAGAATKPGPRTRPANRPNRPTPEQPPYFVARATADDDPENVDTQIAKAVCKELEQHKDGPFFIVAGFHKPHVPHVAPKRFFDMYPPEKIVPVAVPAGDEKDIPAVALSSKMNYQPDMPERQKQEIIAAYYACTSYFDAEVGEVMKTMDRLQLWDNTIVVFIGDHGWGFGEHNWWAKASLFEESCRAPMIIAAPGIKSGQVSPRVVQFLDIAPTLTEMCALPPMKQAQGTSLLPLLKDPAAAWDKSAYTLLGNNGRSIRNQRYRYTEWNRGSAGAELYDHEKDPNELTNLASDPAHADVVAQMKELLASREKEIAGATPEAPAGSAR